jgi:hypothetical protein
LYDGEPNTLYSRDENFAMKATNHFVSGRNKFFILALLSLLIFGCASGGASRDSMNKRISISYATVVSVEQVQLKSEAGKAAAIGGLWGLLGGFGGNRRDSVSGAVVGAALLGGTTLIAEGSNNAFAYILKGKNNQEFKILTEQGGIQAGDCVAVESGTHTNLRRVSAVYCQTTGEHTTIDKSLLRKIEEEASECHQAKEQLLITSGAEFDAVVRKVKALCDD